MVTKGIVYVPATGASGCQPEDPGVQQVANRPLVGLILDALCADGVQTIAVLAPNAQLDAVRASAEADPQGARGAKFIGLGEGTGLVDALHAVAAFVGEDPALVHYATGLLDQSAAPILEALGAHPADLTLLLHRGRQSYIPLDDAIERLLGVAELGNASSHLSLTGVAAFAAGAIARLTSRSPAVAVDAAPEDASSQQELIALADRLADAGFTVAAGLVAEWCEYAPTPTAALELNRCVLDRQGASPVRPAEDAGNRIEGRVVIDPTAEVTSSVIVGPSLIGARAWISDSYIGPYTTIGADAVIEDAEVVRSIVGDGARIAHVSGRIEGSTIGAGAHIFRDFSLPRALRLHVGENVEVSLD